MGLAISVERLEKTKPLRLANKRQAAEWFGISVQAVDGWISRGCPAVTRGSAGVAWVFDLRALAEWRYSSNATQDAASDPESLSPKDRLDWYRGTRERTRHMQEIGELIPAAEYEAALASALKAVAAGLESLPDLLERDAALSGPAVERAINVIDGLRDTIYRRLAHESN